MPQATDELPAQREYKDPARLLKRTVLLLYLEIAITVVALLAEGFEYKLFLDLKNGVFGTQEQALAVAGTSDNLKAICGIAQLVIYLLAGFYMLKSIHRANNNARALGAQNMDFTPRGSILWYFVPLANLVMPYKAMKEIWQASADPQNWKPVTVPKILSLWWFLWIVMNIASNIAMRADMKTDSIDDAIGAVKLMFLSDALMLPLCLVFISILRDVFAMQAAHYREQAA